MNAEQKSLEQRAARFAALSDPARLRIVDLLALGDLSPTEIQVRLGMSSSLLAHHLNLLEREGVVIRSRSEGDRRRSYVRFVAGALSELGPDCRQEAQRVVFVCKANSARSQLAAALWSQTSSIPATSAGTHPAAAIDVGAVAVAKRHGISLKGFEPRALDQVLGEHDCIVTVCDNAREEIGDATCLHWSVPDPVAIGTPEAFEAAYDEIARRVEDLAPLFVAA